MLRWIHQIRIYFKILLNETENRQSDLKIQIRIALKERTRILTLLIHSLKKTHNNIFCFFQASWRKQSQMIMQKHSHRKVDLLSN